MAAKKKPGRPKHDPAAGLTEKMWTRCSAQERSRWEARATAEGRNPSAHLRHCCNFYEQSKKSKN